MTPTRRLAASSAAVLTLTAFAPAPTVDLVPALACDELTAMSWSGFALDDVSEVEAGANDPAHCRVRGTIDEEIHFELLLPLAATGTVASSWAAVAGSWGASRTRRSSSRGRSRF